MSGKGRVERAGQGSQGRAEHQHSQAIQLFSMIIFHDLRLCLLRRQCLISYYILCHFVLIITSFFYLFGPI